MSVRHVRRLPLEELQPFLLTVPEPPELLSWPFVFDNSNPVEIEVGFGKGLFLITAGQACPQTNFLGVEIDRAYQLYTANRLAKRQLTNVHVTKADARELFRHSLPASSVQAIHVYFPDPWWKKRHQKRRVFTADFVAQCERVLQPGGRLHVVTDVEEYYSVICDLIHDSHALAALSIPETVAPAHDLDYLTNYERKFRKEGRSIFRALYERTEPLAPIPLPETGRGAQLGRPAENRAQRA